MVYYVVECQTNNGTGSAIVNTYSTKAQAEQQYHLILSAAAVSQVEKHGAIIIGDDFRLFDRQIYDRTLNQTEE